MGGCASTCPTITVPVSTWPPLRACGVGSSPELSQLFLTTPLMSPGSPHFKHCPPPHLCDVQLLTVDKWCVKPPWPHASWAAGRGEGGTATKATGAWSRGCCWEGLDGRRAGQRLHTLVASGEEEDGGVEQGGDLWVGLDGRRAGQQRHVLVASGGEEE